MLCLDLRKKSGTFGKVFDVKLTSANNIGIFIPKGFKETMAVLDLKREKDKISMRGKACRKLLKYLKRKNI